MAALGAYAAAFGAPDRVFVLRNQLAYIQSLYLEMQRQYRMPAVDDLREAVPGGPPCLGHVPRLRRPLRPRARRLPGGGGAAGLLRGAGGGRADITAALLDALGCGRRARARAAAGRQANVSPEPLAAWAANRVPPRRIAGPALVRLATEAFAEEFGDEARSTLFTPAEVAAIASAFRADEPGARGALPRRRCRPSRWRRCGCARPRPSRPGGRELLAAARPAGSTPRPAYEHPDPQ